MAKAPDSGVAKPKRNAKECESATCVRVRFVWRAGGASEECAGLPSCVFDSVSVRTTVCGRRTVSSKATEYVRHYHRLRQHNKHSAVPGVPCASRAPWAAACFGRASASGQQADAGIERPLFRRRAFSKLQCSCLKRDVIGLAGVGAGAPSASAVAVLAVAGSPRHRRVEAEVVEEPEPRSGDRRIWS